MFTFRQFIVESYPLTRKFFIDYINDLKKQGYGSEDNENTVDEYLNKFKDLVKRNIIKPPDNDINKWREAGWDEFKMFVFDTGLNAQITKSQLKKNLKNQARKIYEDDRVLVVQPLTRAASCKYGATTKWCISSKDPSHWEGYEKDFASEGAGFYFIIDKKENRDNEWNPAEGKPFEIDNDEYKNWIETETDPFTKIALLVNDKGTVSSAWDAHDEAYKYEDLNTIKDHLVDLGVPLDKMPFKFVIKSKLLDLLYKRLPQYKTNAKFQEYVSEAEHQEGEAFWDDNFETIEDIIEDFRLYKQYP